MLTSNTNKSSSTPATSYSAYAKAAGIFIMTTGLFLFAKTTGYLFPSFFSRKTEEDASTALITKDEIQSITSMMQDTISLNEENSFGMSVNTGNSITKDFLENEQVRFTELALSETLQRKKESEETTFQVLSAPVRKTSKQHFKTMGSIVGNYTMLNEALSVTVANNYAYVTAGDADGLQILNTTNPSNPIFVGSYNTPGYAYDVDISGSYAFVADQESGLQIINIVNPTGPALAGSYNTPGVAMGVTISGSYAYVADGNSGGLQIISISNPTNPTFVGHYATSGAARDVVIANYAYVAVYTGGLQIINVANKASPSLVGSYNTPGSAMRLAVANNYAYVADGSGGLQIINIVNPASPSLAGTYPTLDNIYDVVLSGNYAYLASDDYGLEIINIANPANPTLVSHYDTPGNADRVYLSGNYVFVADRESGLQIISLLDPPALTKNQLSGSEGQTITITSAELSANDPDSNNAALIFTVSNITHGQFELFTNAGVSITTFTQQQITDGVVRFVHDGGEVAPSYQVSVSDGSLSTTPTSASINYTPVNDAPVLGNNQLTVNESQTVNLTAVMLSATDPDNNNATLIFTVSNVTHGQFELSTNAGINITSFIQQQITDGLVRFVHDGGEAAPSYEVSVSDGSLSTTPTSASINYTPVNDAPVLDNNQLTVSEGQTINLTAAMLSATDPDNNNSALIFIISNVTHGQFELSTNAGINITSFTQQQISDGVVLFVHDGGEVAPSYEVSVSDGELTTAPAPAAMTYIPILHSSSSGLSISSSSSTAESAEDSNVSSSSSDTAVSSSSGQEDIVSNTSESSATFSSSTSETSSSSDDAFSTALSSSATMNGASSSSSSTGFPSSVEENNVSSSSSDTAMNSSSDDDAAISSNTASTTTSSSSSTSIFSSSAESTALSTGMASSSTGENISSTDRSAHSTKKRLSTAEIAGISAAGTISIGICIGLTLWCRKKNVYKKQQKHVLLTELPTPRKSLSDCAKLVKEMIHYSDCVKKLRSIREKLAKIQHADPVFIQQRQELIDAELQLRKKILQQIDRLSVKEINDWTGEEIEPGTYEPLLMHAMKVTTPEPNPNVEFEEKFIFLESLINKGVNLNIRNYKGESIIHVAEKNNNRALVRFVKNNELIEKQKAALNKKIRHSETERTDKKMFHLRCQALVKKMNEYHDCHERLSQIREKIKGKIRVEEEVDEIIKEMKIKKERLKQEILQEMRQIPAEHMNDWNGVGMNSAEAAEPLLMHAMKVITTEFNQTTLEDDRNFIFLENLINKKGIDLTVRNSAGLSIVQMAEQNGEAALINFVKGHKIIKKAFELEMASVPESKGERKHSLNTDLFSDKKRRHSQEQVIDVREVEFVEMNV